ncbi:maltokinase N-terminal cap-like domain-containing protein [Agrococcus sp. SGAir0287]|uniref:maltokinase N-terminal cap-like domain-containing protein n=1 Tax=Agrococcus sp. SGAir0287 TaxID=2070347 RepID=UPI0010CD00EE|nr:aminoglycoside phosphotransferase [Agrococcus sp. SGAir0287]QCR19859.1 aminoglycoside phosphotransferase [Agrococcus sp. SGAir0287]
MPLDPDAVLAAIADWAPGRRWYPLKGSDAALTLEALLPVEDEVAIVLVRAGDATLQVPVALRDEPGDAPIGVVDGRWLVDATHDAAALQAMLRPSDALAVDGRVPPVDAVRVITSEQSNTSVIGTAEPPWIAKVFRVVDDGEHPDVAVTGALTRAGCDRVPALLAASRATWSAGGVTRSAGLAAVSEFVAGADDAWTLVRDDAVRALRGEARDDLAIEDLGRAVAQVHVALAETLGARGADQAASDAFVETLRSRVRWAREQSRGALAHLDDAIDAHVGTFDALRVGLVQRIHGDLHLGQVLRQHGRGYLLLDFEGEPLRPLAERLLPEPTERDVAGMLRSFDYAAGAAAIEVGVDVASAAAWTASTEAAFLAGYRTVRGEGDPALIRALLVDKALYEVVYEVRSRPDWVPIPRSALERLLA